MRIVAGQFRGRKLKSPPSLQTRPTSDRLRETLFNILAPRIEGVRFLDLCAGSGAVGIEALSRGAASATFVDSDAAALRAVRSNLERLGIGGARVVRSDALAFLRGAAGRAERWDLVLCDPPYRLAPRLSEPLGSLLVRVLATGAGVVVESSSRHPLELELPLRKERRHTAPEP